MSRQLAKDLNCCSGISLYCSATFAAAYLPATYIHTISKTLDLGRSFTEGVPPLTVYFSIRITPTPIVPRSRSGYFSRAFSAAAFVLNGFDNGVNWPSMYLKSSHCSIILGI
jgi:hypothetical protein